MFRHFDKDKIGRLDHDQFKSCLRALGYDLPMVEEGHPEPEFQAILDGVDPNRDGHVSLQVIIRSFSKLIIMFLLNLFTFPYRITWLS